VTQRYTSKTALERMEKGLCPECGRTEADHAGWGSAGCSLTDNGVADRIAQYRRDKEGKLPVSNFAGKEKEE